MNKVYIKKVTSPFNNKDWGIFYKTQDETYLLYICTKYTQAKDELIELRQSKSITLLDTDLTYKEFIDKGYKNGWV